MNRPGLPVPERTTHALALLLVVGLVAPFVVFAAPGLVGAQHSFVVLSGSMEPAIDTGDAVLVERVDPTAVEAGDVVTFRDGGASTPVTHRVVEVREGEFGRQFVTKGDANEDSDPGVVTESELLGRVAFTLPLVGYVVGFGGTPAGVVALVVVPFGLLLATELRSVVSGATRGRREPDDVDDTDGPNGVGEAERANGTEGTEGTARTDETMDTTATRTAAGTVTPDEPTGGITLAPGELRIGLGVLLCAGPYTAWVAYVTTAGWAVAAAVAANASLALAAALYLSGRDEAAESGPTDAPTGGVDDGR
ncbi:signal peptidase I [Halobium salinum]|uniref:Signal peptidase I n=1 Tax=Halobium salinum TaxID=1364940 RepID=A0ABD5PB51_9EURY|nr:signal peptidase I [Halobium salinum]